MDTKGKLDKLFRKKPKCYAYVSIKLKPKQTSVSPSSDNFEIFKIFKNFPSNVQFMNISDLF